MELKRDMFFDSDGELKTREVVNAIASYPNEGERIMKFIWDIMEEEYEYEFEKKWLKMKYEHDMKELKEKYDVLDD